MGLVCLCSAGFLWGEVREQAVELETGWNAVSFEVDPEVSDPELVFGPVGEILEVVAYVPDSIGSSFLTDPGEELRNRASWPRWRRAGGGVELLNNLGDLQPRLPYFIRASAPATLTVAGPPAPKTWPLQRSGFGFVSFPVSDRESVTLEDYFRSAAVQPEGVFRLEGSQWEPVGNSQLLERNRVYCVRFSRAPPDFFGPVDFRNLPATRPVALSSRSGSVALDYRAFAPDAALALQIEKVSGDLQLEVRDGFLSEEEIPLNGSLSLTGLAPGEAGRLFLRALNYGSAIVRLADGEGTTAFYAVIENPEPEE